MNHEHFQFTNLLKLKFKLSEDKKKLIKLKFDIGDDKENLRKSSEKDFYSES